METKKPKPSAKEFEAKNPTRTPQVVKKQMPEACKRRALRVLAMVHELHKADYQRLRIWPGLSSSGCWRCAVVPVSNILKLHGAMAKDNDGLLARYTAAEGNAYFGWRDAKSDTARELATKFIERFPEIARHGLGEDWNYAGWYVQMLGFAERGDFPVAYADWYGELDPRWLPTGKGFDHGLPTESRLPMPPGGQG
jgi:hypothetical protein